jgi:hypothetical protein
LVRKDGIVMEYDNPFGYCSVDYDSLTELNYKNRNTQRPLVGYRLRKANLLTIKKTKKIAFVEYLIKCQSEVTKKRFKIMFLNWKKYLEE